MACDTVQVEQEPYSTHSRSGGDYCCKSGDPASSNKFAASFKGPSINACNIEHPNSTLPNYGDGLSEVVYRKFLHGCDSSTTTRASTLPATNLTLNAMDALLTLSTASNESLEDRKGLYLDQLKRIEGLDKAWGAHLDSYNYHDRIIRAAEKLSDLVRYSIIFYQIMIYEPEAYNNRTFEEPQAPPIPQCVIRHATEQLDILRTSVDSAFSSRYGNLTLNTATNIISGDKVEKPSEIIHVNEQGEAKILRFESPQVVKCIQLNDNGMKYEGEVSGSQLDGFGICYFSDGSVYAGKWCKSKMHGYGKLTCPNGHTFEGDFCSSIQFGKGIFTESHGRKFIGNWEYGKLHGTAICLTLNEIQCGEWRNGNFLHWHSSEVCNLMKEANISKLSANEINPDYAYKNFSTLNPSIITGSRELVPKKSKIIALSQNKIAAHRRINKHEWASIKQKQLDEWETQAKLLPHVPHINYNRVLGRWYARVRDTHSGKRLWKGYTCSIHGFLKAREMAIERLSSYNKFSNAPYSEKSPPNNSAQNASANELLPIGISKTEAGRMKNSTNLEIEQVKKEPLQKKLCEKKEFSENFVTNGEICTNDIIAKYPNKESLQYASIDELLAISRDLEHVTGVYFNPKCRGWMAYYNQSVRGSKGTGKRRFIKQFLNSQCGFFEARDAAIRKRKAWERIYDTNFDESHTEASQGLIYSEIMVEADESPSTSITSADFFLQSDEMDSCNSVFYNEGITTHEELQGSIANSLQYKNNWNDNAVHYKDTKPNFFDPSRKNMHTLQLHPQNESLDFSRNDEIYKISTSPAFDHPKLPHAAFIAKISGECATTRTTRKRRALPKDFVGIRHDQWGKGWRCVWSNEYGMQKSRFFGENKWGKDTCKRKAEELMKELLDMKKENKELPPA
ncbi:putative Phosphatidylinositol 4-phosphate 5-kinase 7 [Cardiosporidium cionae]|uniref:Phosphatidylinositol 4-phosphate 5-kinase 7 n=1 Tax=Cardiosporidium cionae TaxID=476202 RepID=A0ABQ7JFF3_9APIC|nr:putative Phosphatidylinositol 4-phosphate 5-kinase 7 [Cardiosporidium cionae]|eukprot:KAF8822741.1 putative Phosphatidylinositol 4-phosphate 5-kinase 7 [Cardiosporidium cionae]